MIACPFCGSDTAAIETRSTEHYVRRRRACRSVSCAGRVTTIEMAVPTGGMFRIGKAGPMMLISTTALEQLRAMVDELIRKPGDEHPVDVVWPPTEPAT